MLQKILGFFLIVAGLALAIKAEWFLQQFGRIQWAEQKLGTEGGSRLFYKLLGIGSIFFGMILILGFFEGIILFIFSPLIPK